MDQIILSGKSEDTPLIIGEFFCDLLVVVEVASSPVNTPACEVERWWGDEVGEESRVIVNDN